MAFNGEDETELNECDENKTEDQKCCVINFVMKDIFSNCDPDQEGAALVSKLIEYITPFMSENLDALFDLKTVLDPNNVNPYVDAETFYKAMREWTNKLSSNVEEDFHNITPRDLNKIDERQLSFVQSTPRSSFGHSLIRGYVESGTLNLSNVSTYSCTDNNTNGVLDRFYFEEQIRELEHQKKKLTEELVRVRLELTTTLDANEILYADVNQLSKKLSNEQKIVEQLHKECKKEEEFEEALNSAHKQIDKLKKTVLSLEKSNTLLEKDLEQSNIEKKNLENKMKQINKAYEESVGTIAALQTELAYKDLDIASIEENKLTLQGKINEQLDIIQHSNLNNERLRVEKSTLEKLLRERVAKHNVLFNASLKQSAPNRSSSFSEYSRITRDVLTKNVHAKAETFDNPEMTDSNPMVQFTPRIDAEKFEFYNYDSPLARNRRRASTFNSPRLLEMLEKPISPQMDTPPLASSRHSKRSVDSDDCFENKFAENTSTPDNENARKQSINFMKDFVKSIISNVVDVCHANENVEIFSTESPPVMYIVDRSDERVKKTSQDEEMKICSRDSNAIINNNNNSLLRVGTHHSVSPNVSNCSIESGDEDLYYKLQLLETSHEQHVSLEAEINQAFVQQNGLDHHCEYYIKLIESEEKILNLQCQLMQHENNNTVIERREFEIEELKLNNNECHEKIENLLEKLSDVEKQLSLSRNKEEKLHNKFKVLQNSLQTSTTYITEVRLKISEYSELEVQCKVLEEKIDVLESENKNKYFKILELNKEIEKLRHELTLNNNEEVLNEKIESFQKAKHDLEMEKVELVNKIFDLEQEKSKMKEEKQEAWKAVLQLEEQQTENNSDYSNNSDQGNLDIDLLIKNEDLLREKIVNLEEQKKMLELEKDELASRITKLETDKELLTEEKGVNLKKLKEFEFEKFTCESQYKLIKDQNDLLELKVTNFEIKNQKLFAENESLQKKLNEIKYEFDKVSEQKLEERKNFEMLQMDLIKLQGDVAKYETQNKKIANLEQELLRLETIQKAYDVLKVKYEICQQEHNDAYTKLQHKFETLFSTNNSLNDSISYLNIKIEQISEQNEELQNHINESNIECNKSNNENLQNEANLKELFEKLKVENQILNDSVTEKDVIVLELQTKIKNIKEEFDNLKASLVIKNETIANLEANDANYVQELTEQKQKNQELKVNLEVSAKDLLELKEKLNVASNEIEKLNGFRDVNVQLERQRKQELEMKDYFYDKYINLENELFCAKSEVKNLKEGNEILLKDFETQTENLKHIEGNNKSLLKENDNLKTSVHNLNEELASFIEENVKISRDNYRLNLENEKFTDKILVNAETETEPEIIVERELKELKETIQKLTMENEELLTAPACKNCKILESKVSKKLSFDKLSVKSRKLEQKIEFLEEQLSKERERCFELEQQNKTICNEKLNIEINIHKFETIQKEVNTLNVMNDELIKKNENVLKDSKKKEEENVLLRIKVCELQEQLANAEIINNELNQKSKDYFEKMKNYEKENILLCSRLRDADNYTVAVHKDYEGKEKEINELKLKLFKSETNLSNIEDKLRIEEDKYNNILEHIHVVEQRLWERRLRLGKSTLNTVASWRNTLENQNMKDFLESMDSKPVSPIWNLSGPLDEQMFQLKHQVHMTSMLLDNFTAIKELIQTNEVAVQTISHEPTISKLDVPRSRGLRRFSLKPATLIVRSASPDSPSAEIFNKFNSPGKPDITLNKSPSPDSAGDYLTRPFDEIQEKNVTNQSNSSNDYFESFEDEPDVNIPTEQEISPNLNDRVLENLGLLGSNDNSKISEKEIEEKFRVLVMALSLDKFTIKDRLAKQLISLTEKEEAFAVIMSTLENSSDNSAAITRACEEISSSAFRYGALKHEEKQISAMTLLVDYLKIVRGHLKEFQQSTVSLQICKPTIQNDYHDDEDYREISMQNRNICVQNFNKYETTSKTCYFVFVFVVFFASLATIYQSICNSKSWDDHFAPYLKKDYRFGPPPV